MLVPNEAFIDSCSLGRCVTTDCLNKVRDRNQRPQLDQHVLYSVINHVRYTVPDFLHDAPHTKQAVLLIPFRGLREVVDYSGSLCTLVAVWNGAKGSLHHVD